jgi:hypothetical protein
MYSGDGVNVKASYQKNCITRNLTRCHLYKAKKCCASYHMSNTGTGSSLCRLITRRCAGRF